MAIKSRRTVGSHSIDMLLNNDIPTHSPLEQTYEQLKDYPQDIEKCIASAKSRLSTDFYIVVLTKKERLLRNVMRNYFFSRISCPTPNYDQVVYRFNISDNKLELIWVIPDKKACLYLMDNRKDVDPSQYSLLSYVLKFKDGTLFKIARSEEHTSELQSH